MVLDPNDRRYQIMAEARQSPENDVVERKTRELEFLNKELVTCHILAQGLTSEFWKTLRDKFIKSECSQLRILESPRESRDEIIGEVRILERMKSWIKNRVEAIPNLEARIKKLTDELNTRESQKSGPQFRR
jgi:hypothetical protein